MLMSISKLILPLLACLSFQFVEAKQYHANDINAFNKVKNELLPGDTLLFGNGTWNNVDIIITNKGTATSPIVFIAEKAGLVLCTGNSTLHVGGEYVEVNGLTFINGYVKSKEPVISFRENGKNLANNSRVTNCVIDNYNNPDRLADDNWIAMFGKNNRFDHNHISNKKNLGTTIIVELNDIRNQDNRHRIDHNYFGERMRLGSNGGETMRVGNSTFSRLSSRTIVEDNYFYKCSGEVEIISVKSGDNILRRNTFFECEGGLVLRHGNRNTIESNFFIGNHKPNTGGVRVINAGHKIYNNFFYQLDGERFRSALTILNGVPNSPINRYDQVKDVVIANNVFVDCKSVELCAGKDLERTARPSNVLMAGNVFNQSNKNMFVVNDNIDGIRFLENYSKTVFTSVPPKGFLKTAISVNDLNNGWKIRRPIKFMPATLKSALQKELPDVNIEMPTTFTPFATVENTGVAWYKEKNAKAVHGKVILVEPGENTLYEKALTATDGDTLLLTGGEYILSKTIFVNKKIHVASKDRTAPKPVVQFTGEQGGFSFFSIENGGTLSLSNLVLNGLSENGTAESFIRTSQQPMIEHYNLYVDRCDFLNITDGRKHALKVNKASYADIIQFTNCIFNNISGDVISIAAEKEDKGIYNAEYVIFKNCLFNKILMGAIDVYRGGNDESTTGPFFIMDHCTFNEVANIELGYVARLTGVQYSNITNCIFYNSGRAGRTIKYEDYGWTKNSISYSNSFIAGKVESFYHNIIGKQMLSLDPRFVNIKTMNFQLKLKSLLKNKGNDGRDMGCLWKNGLLSYK